MSDKDHHPGTQESIGYAVRGKSLLARIDDAAPVEPPPRRAFRLALDAHADTPDELADALEDLAADLRRDALYLNLRTSGSVGHGYHLEIARRDVTHDQWWDELMAWRAARRESTP